MKGNNAVKVLTFSILATSVAFLSCVDNDKNLFDGEKMKQIYEQTFPVKDIDPDGDWSMSRSVTAHVSVNEDAGVEYTIRIFDANPLEAENDARLLAEGTANNEKSFHVTVDCATAIPTLFVARVDEKGRYLVKPVAIENGEVKAHFGEGASETRSAVTRGVASAVPVMSAPYTAEYIAAKKEEATEIQEEWDLASAYNEHTIYKLPVFKEEERWFKIPEGTFTATFRSSGSHGGAKAIKVIVPGGSKWIIENGRQFDNILEIIVEDGGLIELKDNASLTLTGTAYITVMKGGTIQGNGGEMWITNGSGGNKNYNAGTIACSVIDFNGGPGEFYNYGKLQLDKYQSSTSGATLINHGTIKAKNIDANNNTHIKNGCHIEVEGKFQFGTLLMGYSSEAICGELSKNGNDNDIVMEEQSMLVCQKADLCRHVYGPVKGKALFKIDKIIGNTSELPYSFSVIKNNIICEIKDQKSNGKYEWEWSGFDWLVHRGLQGSATYCNPGKADFMLPKGDCVEVGYNSDDEEDEVELNNAVYTYAFEDNYPNAGDYDFNDIVLNVTMPAAGKKEKELKYKIELRAVGAVRQLGAGLRIKGIEKSSVEEVSFGEATSRRAGSLDNSAIFDNVAFETNGSELVIPLFGDAHYVYGYTDKRPMLNTGNASTPLTDIYTLEVTIKLNNSIDIPGATNDLDFFIAYRGIGNKRTEIHLNKFNTATANGQLANDELLEIIKVINNTWALCVPDKFAYPMETTVITNVYSEFAGWAQDQDSHANWYSSPVSADKVIKY